MSFAAGHESGLGQPNRRSHASQPTHLGMKHLSSKATLAQVRIAIKILGRLNYRRSNSFALQHYHKLMRGVLRSPVFDPVVELLSIDDPSSEFCEAMIHQPLTMVR